MVRRILVSFTSSNFMFLPTRSPPQHIYVVQRMDEVTRYDTNPTWARAWARDLNKITLSRGREI
jgi:hypothetical protein